MLGGWAAWSSDEALSLVMVQRAKAGWVGQLNHKTGGVIIVRKVQEPPERLSGEVIELAHDAIEREVLDGIYARMAEVDGCTFDLVTSVKRLNLLGDMAGVGDLVRPA